MSQECDLRVTYVTVKAGRLGYKLFAEHIRMIAGQHIRVVIFA